ncbi:MAG: hypothetical protein ACI4LO_01940 [Anaerovoracaceae bacterium]
MIEISLLLFSLLGIALFLLMLLTSFLTIIFCLPYIFSCIINGINSPTTETPSPEEIFKGAFNWWKSFITHKPAC